MAHRMDPQPESEEFSSWLLIALAYLFLVWVMAVAGPPLR